VDHESPLQALLDATALVVTHYEADRKFYRGLYHAVFGAEAPDVHGAMQAEGRALWRKLVRAAVDGGELAAIVRVEPLTDVILRTIGAVTLAWLSEAWSHARFELEMSLSVRLLLACVARTDIRMGLLAEIAVCQDLLEAITPCGLWRSSLPRVPCARGGRGRGRERANILHRCSGRFRR
jgi:hypothetical protein